MIEDKNKFYFFENEEVKSSEEPISATFKIRYADPLPSSITMSKEKAYAIFGKEFVEEQLNKNNNMPTNTPIQSLNERILETLQDNDLYVRDSDGAIWMEETRIAANAIERLIVCEKINLLKCINENIHESILTYEIVKLEEQLNKLPQ